MSLQVWLPLNGTLENRGISQVTINNTGSVLADGKTGSCYSYSTTTYTHINGNTIAGLNKFTVCCWVYLTRASTYTVFTSEDDAGYWQFVFSSNYLRVRDTVSGVTGSRMDKAITAMPVSTWTHVAMVYDNGVVSHYRNGELIETLTFHQGASMNAHNRLYIGSDSLNSGYQGNCRVNDFRVYDYCLSAKEVKEISQGLLLHYKMTGTQNITTSTISSAFNYPTFNKSAATGGWSHWAPQGASGTYSQNTDKQYIFNRNNTYSHLVTQTSGSYYILYQSPAFDGGYRSVQAIIKMADGNAPTTDKISFSWNANVGTRPATTFTYLGDGFYLMKCEGFQQDGSNDLVSIVFTNGASAYISEVYLENNTQTCTNIVNATYNSTISDVSGYNRHGTISGSISEDGDTPRYRSCAVFDGNDFIIVPQSVKVKDEISIGMWAYMSNWGNYNSRLISCTEDGGWNFEPASGKLNFVMGTGSSSNTYKSATSTTTLAQLGSGWHHFMGTYDGLKTKLYIDGVLDATNDAYTTKTPIYYNASNGVFIGAEAQTSATVPATSPVKFSGKMSDVRIYATALSAEDIMDLYSTSAYIHNTGTVSGFEITESAENLLKYENTVLYTKPTNTDTRGKYTTRNGEVAMAFRATDTYYGSGDERNGKLLYGFFKQNTSYVFDLWMDMDDVIYQDINRVGGFTIVYTDGTTETTFQLTGSTNPYTGWQHRVLVTNPNKTVKSISIYYWINSLFYVRSDSFIVEASQTDISKNGIIRSGQFVENTDVANIGRATFNTNKIIEI